MNKLGARGSNCLILLLYVSANPNDYIGVSVNPNIHLLLFWEQRRTAYIKLMTHNPDFGAESRRQKLARISGLCVIPIWYQIFWDQILAPVSCEFYFVPISGMHVTTMATPRKSAPSVVDID